jgi:hypothetical protein
MVVAPAVNSARQVSPAFPGAVGSAFSECTSRSYRVVGLTAGGVVGFVGEPPAEKLWVKLLARAFVGLVLVDMPLSLGKLPFASRMLSISWAVAGATERAMIRRAAFIYRRLRDRDSSSGRASCVQIW